MKLTKSNHYRAFAFNNLNSVHIVEQKVIDNFQYDHEWMLNVGECCTNFNCWTEIVKVEIVKIQVENLNCTVCNEVHYDIDNWALDPHRTHLCLHCGNLFKGSVRGVSHPTFDKLSKPAHIEYVNQ